MTFIICEVGSNWTSFEDCFNSIIAAKECGADAVKFQMYTHKELYGYDVHRTLYSKDESKLQLDPYFTEPAEHNKIKLPGELPRDWVPLLHAKCQDVGIEFMCTAFSPEGYRFIDPYVKRHKIASAENTDKSILETVKSLGKHTLISTGGCDLSDVWDIEEFFETEPLGFADITLMYCVSAYPAKGIVLENVGILDNEVKAPVGYSCHSDDWYLPTLAVSCFDATIVEKHFKLRDMDTPDNPHSILPEDFKKMVEVISGKKKIGWQMPDPQEADFIKYSKRRWIPELNGYYRTKKP